MKYHFLFHIVGLFFSCFGQINGQESPYIIDDEIPAFSILEGKLLENDPDTVWSLSQAILEKYDDPKIKGIAHFYTGQANSMLFRTNPACFAYESAILFFERANYTKGLVMTYAKLGDEYFFQQDLTKADSFYDCSLRYFPKIWLYHPVIDVYQKKANISIARKEPKKGIDFLKKALVHSLSQKENYLATDIINQISTNYHAIGQLDSAIFYFRKLMGLKKEIGDVDGLISDHSALGNLYRERGEYENAQHHLMYALQIAETEKDSFAMITLFKEVGDIHTAQNIWKTGESYYLKALSLAKRKKRAFSEAGCHKKLGDIYLLQDNKEAAVRNYESALSIYEKLHNMTKTADVLISLSKVFEEKSEYTQAKSLLLKALRIRETSNDLMSTLKIKQELAAIEINTGNIQEGIQYANECLLQFRAMKDKEGLKNIYALLADANNLAGNYKKAYQFYRSYTAEKDSLNSVKLGKAIKELDARYNTEKKDKEIAQKNTKIQAQQLELLKKSNQLLVLAGGLSLLVLSMAFLFFVFIKNKQLNQKRIEVLEKEKETQRLRSIIEGEEKERKRFARELHDGLGAQLATVKMQINGIKRKIPEAEELPTYQKAESLIDDACRSVREISHDLMPYVLEQQGLFFAINDMCQNLTAQFETEFDFISFGDEHQLGDMLKITLFRVVQELLKNIVNHAEAKEVIVQLAIEENEAMLIVEDDGKGFDISAAKKGIGIDNIRSRINYMKGTLEMDSTPGEGSTFTVQLPI